MLVVIGGGPYGIATAATAIEKGIETVVVGRPLGFWTDNMPEGMYLRSGPDWHLDASGVHTFEAFLEERGIGAAEIDPVPIAVFRRLRPLVPAREGRRRRRAPGHVRGTGRRRRPGRRSRAVAASRSASTTRRELVADAVVAAPGVRYFQNRAGLERRPA